MPGRRPQIAVSGSTILAYSGTDYELGDIPTYIAVSRDSGATFHRLNFPAHLFGPGLALVANDAIVVGTVCQAPSDAASGDSCLSSSAQLAGYTIDLDSGVVQPTPAPPVVAAINDTIGTSDGGAALFDVDAATGRALLSWTAASGWQLSPLPAATSRVCLTPGRLTAVSPAHPLQSPPTSSAPASPPGEAPVTVPAKTNDLQPVSSGEALFSAQVSADAGRTWSKPVPFMSAKPRDFSFTVGVSCGPSAIMAYTLQLGVFSPDTQSWRRADMPVNASSISPGVAAAWRDDSHAVIWSDPQLDPVPVAQTGSPTTGTATAGYDRFVIDLSMNTLSPTVTAEPIKYTGAQPQILVGAGAQSHGYVLLVGGTATLGRVK